MMKTMNLKFFPKEETSMDPMTQAEKVVYATVLRGECEKKLSQSRTGTLPTQDTSQPEPKCRRDGEKDLAMAIMQAASPTVLQRNMNQLTILMPLSSPGAFPVNGPNECLSDESQVSHGEVTVEDHPPLIVTAAEVTEDQVQRMEQEIRNRILQEAVQANQVVPIQSNVAEEEDETGTGAKPEQKAGKKGLFAVMILVVLIVTAIGLYVGLANKSSDSLSTQAPTSTLSIMEAIRQRGYIRCGIIYSMPGFSSETPPFGINTDQCRALSIAVFGDADRLEMVELNSTRAHTLASLSNGTVDVLTVTVQHTMERDIVGGYTFSIPYFYSQSRFMGVPDYVDCADRLDAYNGICRHLKVCFSIGSVQEKVLKQLLAGTALVPFQSQDDWVKKFQKQECNAMLANTAFINEETIGVFGYQGDYKVGVHVYAGGPLALVTAEKDREWSNLVDVMIQALFWAEANNITQGTPTEEITPHYPDGMDPKLAGIISAIVSKVGNYGEVYQRNLQALVPRGGLNGLHDATTANTTGLLYAYSFGDLEMPGHAPMPGSTLDTVERRGVLRCGVRPRGGFASLVDGQWEGMDVEVCRAISAAIFEGSPDQVHFVNVTDSGHGMFASLASSQVDLVAGAPVSVQAGYLEASTGTGFAFSRPYYFEGGNGNKQTAIVRAVMTRQDDCTWSGFVFWIINSLLYAEEKQITQDTSIEMPVVYSFGEYYKQMFRDAVSGVGSYQEVYNRTLESLVPRKGSLNTLNADFSAPEHYAVPLV